MPFFLIKGNFIPNAGTPDGDSVRFRAKNNNHWAKLEGRPVELGMGVETKGTVQLRLEGIDAIEKGATKPLAVQARDSLLGILGYHEVNEPEPSGYILARMTDDLSRRPICFAFAGSNSTKDGAEEFLGPQELRRSANLKQLAAGFAYPLYYNTLFTSLRNEFTNAYLKARKAKRGYWPKDATEKGVTISSKDSLDDIPPIWPKLWRRLQEHLRNKNGLDGFKDMLERKNERVDLLDIMEERGLQDIVRVSGNTVKLMVSPEDIRVRGKAGKRR